MKLNKEDIAHGPSTVGGTVSHFEGRKFEISHARVALLKQQTSEEVRGKEICDLSNRPCV